MKESGKNIFLKSILQSPWTLLTVAARAIGTLSVIKIVSVYFGSAGLALFSHFQNLIALMTQIPDQGTNLGVIRHYANLSEEGKKVLITTSFFINLLLFVLIGAILLFFREFFLHYFDSFLSTPLYFWLLMASILFVLLNSLAFAFLYARQSFKLLFGITIGNVILIILFVYYGSLGEDLQMTMLAFAGGWALYSILNFVFLTIKGELPAIRWTWDPSMNRLLLRFIGIAVVGVILGKWVDFFVRDFAIDWFGGEITGHWQAQVRMSDSYRSVFLGTLGVIFYSQISRMNPDSLEWSQYIRKMLRLALIVSGIGLLLVWLLKSQIILLLFQPDLLPAADFIEYQLLADLFALPSYLLVYIIISTERWNLFVSLHLASAFIYVIGIAVLLGFTDLGIAGIPVANMIRFALFLGLLILYQYKQIKKQ